MVYFPISIHAALLPMISLIDEHLLDYCFDLSIGIFIYCSDSLDKPLFINRHDLIKDNPSALVL